MKTKNPAKDRLLKELREERRKWKYYANCNRGTTIDPELSRHLLKVNLILDELNKLKNPKKDMEL